MYVSFTLSFRVPFCFLPFPLQILSLGLYVSGWHLAANMLAWHLKLKFIPNVFFLSNAKTGRCLLIGRYPFIVLKIERDSWLSESWRGRGVHSCHDLSLSVFDNMCKAQVISSLCTLGQIASHNCELLSCLTARADKWTCCSLLGSLEMMDATSMLRLVCVEILVATCTGKCHSVLNSWIQLTSTHIWISGLLTLQPASISSYMVSYL